MDYLDAVILGIVEGLTEFLPVSSTGHLTIAEKALGLDVDDPAVTAYTAVIQMGAILAVVVYFARDIWRIANAWVRGLFDAQWRGHLDHRMGWYVIVGSIPVGIAGLLGKDLITGPLRSLWVVGVALIAWSAVMWLAERVATQERGEKQLTLRDAIVVGLVQITSLVPGVSRSGATISAGLFLGLDRVAATRLSFFLSIPALTAAGIYELPSAGRLARRRPDRRGDGRGVRGGLRKHRVAAEVRRPPLHRLVRALPHRPGPGHLGAAQCRSDLRDLTRV